MKSITTLSRLNLHQKRRISQRMGAVIQEN